MARIGVQASTIKESFAEAGPYATLRRMTEVGYRSVEISQVAMTPENVAEIDRARSDLGVEVAALSAPLTTPPGMPGDSLAHDMDKIVSDCRTLGASIVRIGMLPFDAMASREALLGFCARADDAAAALGEQGIGLCYHNHHVEFMRTDGRTMLDTIREKAPRMRFELDVHWIQRGGYDPVRVLQDYAGVVDLVHLKDYRIAPLGPDAFEALANRDMTGFMRAFSDVVQFAEVGEGNLDFPAIIEQSLAGGATHLLVEQDTTYGRDPFESLAQSAKNLRALGYEHLF